MASEQNIKPAHEHFGTALGMMTGLISFGCGFALLEPGDTPRLLLAAGASMAPLLVFLGLTIDALRAAPNHRRLWFGQVAVVMSAIACALSLALGILLIWRFGLTFALDWGAASSRSVRPRAFVVAAVLAVAPVLIAVSAATGMVLALRTWKEVRTRNVIT